MNLENENKELQIVMGDDSELNISEVGDMTNTLKPKNYEKKENIIIPVSLTKKKDKDDSDEDEDDEDEKDKNEENK